MKYIIIIIIWVIGYIASYFYFRYICKEYTGTWTIDDRNRALAFSLLSWACLFATWLVHIIYDENDKPASW